MSILEILLLAAGALLIAASFFIPAKDDIDADISTLVKDEVKKSIDEESDNMRKHVEDVVDEAVGYAEEKTERTLERISNEKIMAVGEYSDTVLEEINKNHKEVMFLYDMLNDKQSGLNETIKKAEEVSEKASKTSDELEKKTEDMIRAAENLSDAKTPARVKASSSANTRAASALPSSAPLASKHPSSSKAVSESVSEESSAASQVSSPASDSDIAPEEKSDEFEIPFEDISEPVKHTSLKARNFFTELALDEAIATVQSVPPQAPEKTVRTLNWAELAVNDANEAEKKEAAKEGREPEKKIEGPQEKLNKEVIELSESGMSEVDIAKQLKMGVGEVSLILGLHNK